MISILIPTYNYNVVPLVKALQGQIHLSQINYEIKVYDDGSTDLPEENEKLPAFQNTIYKKLEKNIGRTAIRNLMATEAKYEWLLFLDADVLPDTIEFLEHYTNAIKNNDYDVVSGGIIYDEIKPSQKQLLRWHYGREREAKSVDERNIEPYFIFSSNLLIKKQLFLEANTVLENYYGLDNSLSNQLKKMNAKVLHIDNPVVHFGLEENEEFIKKALKAVETTVILENKGLMDTNMRPLQKSYSKLKKLHLQHVFSAIISKFKKDMERNFMSEKPNLFWFDLYRLDYYIQLKKKHNA
ncbi:glycosyltransferase family 2 protein [Aequorivita sp. H23M31]|uniref:Glycosyltransferase family 2 protein n=1 Tax=Aequorivita ciconiae TaxID=2494375 RepID=A0A410G6K3_9FLAO|nr:glycosyltransferase family 2 protein [Aequorivita sp. H23M31]QAA82914.1 glycosyltransferase family 2 protein [Aequorivita sp. H23M31]